jgi:hypothetical protein
MDRPMSGEFQTVFGRNLVAELPAFVNRPYLVVTMADLWPRFEGAFDDGLAAVHLVETLEVRELDGVIDALPVASSVIGLGGMRSLGTFVHEAGLWFSIADVRAVDDAVVATVRGLVEGAYGPWTGPGAG